MASEVLRVTYRVVLYGIRLREPLHGNTREMPRESPGKNVMCMERIFTRI